MNDTELLLKQLPLGHNVEILSWDPQTTLFALNKSEGLRSHPNKPGIDKKSLLLAPYDLKEECYLYETPDHELVPVYLLNRLDAPTSGVILLCLNKSLVPVIHKLFKNHKIKKTYSAITKNWLKIKEGTWKDNLSSKKIGEKVRTNQGEGRLAQTRFEFIEHNAKLNLSLVNLMPVTGLTHQLRVQGAIHKHPILGDKTYGDFSFNKEIQGITSRKRLFLHSSQIDVSYVFEGKTYQFIAQASLPEDFNEVMKFNPKSDCTLTKRLL
ncbi:MAG: RNA pseudouridine synthase [Verrucomicrobia bacterium]|nr:MAG: RNA pseudouridine synthase [Verrucomicrobiota bacterium]